MVSDVRHLAELRRPSFRFDPDPIASHTLWESPGLRARDHTQ